MYIVSVLLISVSGPKLDPIRRPMLKTYFKYVRIIYLSILIIHSMKIKYVSAIALSFIMTLGVPSVKADNHATETTRASQQISRGNVGIDDVVLFVSRYVALYFDYYGNVTRYSEFITDLGLDSMSVIELIQQAENEYGVIIPSYNYQFICTPMDLYVEIIKNMESDDDAEEE